MKTDLDELIELLETERKLLEDRIKENTVEWEYLNAHFHSKALFKINSQLRILHKLKDTFYEKKIELERLIELYRLWDEKNKDVPRMEDYYKKKIDGEKNKLQELNKIKKEQLNDDQKIDDALFNLFERRFGGFILYLNVEENLSFTFELTDNNIMDISINIKNVANIDYFFYDDEHEDNASTINIFKGLGFMLNDAGTKMIYKYDMTNFKNAISIKMLLSRIIYDVFNYAELDKPASLIYF